MKKQQLVGQNEVSAKTGLIVVLCTLASLYLISALTSLFMKIGMGATVSSIFFWGLGGAVAVIVYYRFVIRYLYTVDGVKLTIERVYHKKPRLMEHIMLRDIVFVGSIERAQKKYGKMKTRRVTRDTNKNEKIALVFKRGGEKEMLIFQPNEEIRKAIEGKEE